MYSLLFDLQYLGTMEYNMRVLFCHENRFRDLDLASMYVCVYVCVCTQWVGGGGGGVGDAEKRGLRMDWL